MFGAKWELELRATRCYELGNYQRAREILQELRRRRGQRQRPPVELDYLDRLLEQF